MGKALTKEDLIYILQAVLMLSQQPDNALHRDDQGLYVKDYTKDLQAHTDDNSIHVTQDILNVLNRIGINAKDELTYDGKQLMTYISKEANNGLSQKNDGLYVPAFQISKKADNAIGMESDGIYVKTIDSTRHVDNTEVHVTQQDKDKWNNTLNSANQYTDSQMQALPIHDFCFTTQLPIIDIDEKMLYFLADDPDRPLECTYTVYLYREGKWHTLGVTNKTLNNYMTTEQFTKAATAFVHSNQVVLDALSEDTFGNLLFHGKNIFESMAINPDPSNALIIKDGKLYVRDYTQEIESLVTGGLGLVKTTLYDAGEISNSGKYKLKDSIDNYNLILVEYYYKPDNPDRGTPGCIQTAVIDPNTLNEAYSMGMLYILQYGYGVMTSNSQIHIVEDELTVDYYHNVCIYKITGIRKGNESSGSGGTEELFNVKDAVEAAWADIDSDTNYDWLDNN